MVGSGLSAHEFELCLSAMVLLFLKESLSSFKEDVVGGIVLGRLRFRLITFPQIRMWNFVLILICLSLRVSDDLFI